MTYFYENGKRLISQHVQLKNNWIKQWVEDEDGNEIRRCYFHKLLGGTFTLKMNAQ